MRQLQSLLAEGGGSRPEPKAEPKAEAKPKADWKSDGGVTYTIHRPASGESGDAAFKTGTVTVSAAQLDKTPAEAAALLGYALSSPRKSVCSAPCSVALGKRGSAWRNGPSQHRQLVPSPAGFDARGLIAQESRNRYAITPRGQRVLLLLLALARSKSHGENKMPENYITHCRDAGWRHPGAARVAR